MVDKECNLRAGVYKVQTFGTTQLLFTCFDFADSSLFVSLIRPLPVLTLNGSGRMKSIFYMILF